MNIEYLVTASAQETHKQTQLWKKYTKQLVIPLKSSTLFAIWSMVHSTTLHIPPQLVLGRDESNKVSDH